MEREFSWSVSAQRYEDLYRSLVGESEVAASVGQLTLIAHI
jgi:glycogen synthase